ncbi:hypothetical protein Droror1_Dr00021591 [Drosera rotundifolia]
MGSGAGGEYVGKAGSGREKGELESTVLVLLVMAQLPGYAVVRSPSIRWVVCGRSSSTEGYRENGVDVALGLCDVLLSEEGGEEIVVMWRGFRGVIVEMSARDGYQSTDWEELKEEEERKEHPKLLGFAAGVIQVESIEKLMAVLHGFTTALCDKIKQSADGAIQGARSCELCGYEAKKGLEQKDDLYCQCLLHNLFLELLLLGFNCSVRGLDQEEAK